MKVVYPHCAGLDIGKRFLVACVLSAKEKQIRRFGMMTRDILELGHWLRAQGVTQVAMESTGVYWKPLFNLLEDFGFALMLVNPRHFKGVRGRKTDVQDAEWLADLLRHGLLRPSFVPDRAQRELRELVRYRKSLVEERSREVNRLEKVLEGANIKLGAVVSTLTGKSARRMLWALVRGEADVERIVDLAHGRLQPKRAELVGALAGSVGPHQRFMLEEQLSHIEALEARIERLEQEIEHRLRAYAPQRQALETIPGVGRRVAEVIISEMGIDMSRFATSKHLASWVKLCPGQNESAGKRKSGHTGRGNRYLRTALVEAAHAAGRRKGTYLHAQYHRLAARKGKKRAAVAVAHSILVIAYTMLKEGTEYRELGGNYFDERKERAVVQRMQRRLEKLGYAVQLEKRAA